MIIYNNGILATLWRVVMSLIENISKAWDFLSEPLKINIGWLKIPLIFPNGITFDTGIVPIHLIGGSILVLLAWRLVKALIPML